MFTDIVGYSALMSKDEKQAMRLLEKNRAIHESAIGKFNGEYIKEVGDGMLAIFQSSIDAVECAIAIRKACSKEALLKVRIGIHIGDIIESEGDVFGDSVNVASRIESAGEPGGIYISEKAHDDIKNKAGISAEFYGEKMLKNIPDPVRIYSVIAGKKRSETAESFRAGHSTSKDKSIAVLPFIDISPDKDQDYFCDGITEEIINALSHVESFKVIARTSAFAFKGRQLDIREIGRLLNVEILLEGSIRKAGNQLRITAQLIKVADGSHIWSERFDREMKDVFAIQDEISLAILDNLKVELLDEQKVMFAKRHSGNIEAYNLYLKGTYHYQTLTAEGLKKASEYFEKALHKNPDYALAYVGLGYVNWLSATWGDVRPDEAYPRAYEYINRALKIDSTLAEAFSVIGTIHTFYYWNWEEAERNYKYGLQINPNSSMIHLNYSALLTFKGSHEKAIFEAQIAQELDPLSPYIKTRVGEAYHYAGHYDRAMEEYRMTMTIQAGKYDQ
jgi:TolB-like protein